MPKYINPKNNDEFETEIGRELAIEIIGRIATHGCYRDNRPANEKTRGFAVSLYDSWRGRGLSPAQMYWAAKIATEHVHQEERTEAAKKNVQQIGDFSGVKNLFDKATGNGAKRPKIRFDLPEFGEIRLSVAGPKSSSPGAINVTDGGAFGDNVWYGRVSGTEFIVNPRVEKDDAEFVKRFLMLLAKSPALVASEYGKLTGSCCFCGRELTDDRSVFVGYGPICADKYCLPWGDAHEHTAEEIAEFAELVSAASGGVE